MNGYMNKYVGTYSNSIYPQSYVGIKKKEQYKITWRNCRKHYYFFPMSLSNS